MQLLRDVVTVWPHIDPAREAQAPIDLSEMVARVMTRHDRGDRPLYFKRFVEDKPPYLEGYTLHWGDDEGPDEAPIGIILLDGHGAEAPLYIQWQGRIGPYGRRPRLIDVRHVIREQAHGLSDNIDADADAEGRWWGIRIRPLATREQFGWRELLLEHTHQRERGAVWLAVNHTNDVWGAHPTLVSVDYGIEWRPSRGDAGLWLKADAVYTATTHHESVEYVSALIPTGTWAVSAPDCARPTWTAHEGTGGRQAVEAAKKEGRIHGYIRERGGGVGYTPIPPGHQIVPNFNMSGTQYAVVKTTA